LELKITKKTKIYFEDKGKSYELPEEKEKFLEENIDE
jgi:hypothetical protein